MQHFVWRSAFLFASTGQSAVERDCRSRKSHPTRFRDVIRESLRVLNSFDDWLVKTFAFCGRVKEEGPGLGGATFVAMMQAAHLGYGDDPSSIWRLNGPRFRRVFLQSQVRSGPMVIVDERAYVPLQGRFVEEDHVVEALAANGSNNSLDIGTLPRTSWSRQDLLDAHRFHLINERLSESHRDPAAGTAARCPKEKPPSVAVLSTLPSDVS